MGFKSDRDTQGQHLVVHPGGRNAEPASKDQSEDEIDNGLVARFAAGDQKAYEQLVARYKERIYTFIYFQINQKQADAEDLTQDVFIEFYKQGSNYRGESKFSTYLFAISRNIVLNYFRSQRRRYSDQTDSISQQDPDSDAKQSINKELVADDCPVEQVISENMQQKVDSAIEKLKPEERQLLMLTDREGFSYEQVGNILSIKVGTVRSRLNSARNRLIEFLKVN